MREVGAGRTPATMGASSVHVVYETLYARDVGALVVADGRVTQINPAALSILAPDCCRAEVLGRTFTDLFAPESCGHVVQLVEVDPSREEVVCGATGVRVRIVKACAADGHHLLLVEQPSNAELAGIGRARKPARADPSLRDRRLRWAG